MSKKQEANMSKPHPWHGLQVGPNPPEWVTAYIEITPFDSVKYEVDKESGFLMVDRPFPMSSQQPTLYGFIPRTYCGDKIQSLAPQSTSGDHDPLDICVLSERPINRNDILVTCRVVGGMQMIDGGEADDKIIAVIEKDANWGDVTDISELPPVLIERIKHYFLTYKGVPGKDGKVSIDLVYGKEHAFKVVEAAVQDYNDLVG